MIIICSHPLPFGSSNYSLRVEETLVVFLHGSVELWFYPRVAAMAAVTTESLKDMLSQLMGQQVSASAKAASDAQEIQNAFNREMTNRTKEAQDTQNAFNRPMTDPMLNVIQTSGDNAATAEATRAATAEATRAANAEATTAAATAAAAAAA